jgi:hypothetical protein
MKALEIHQKQLGQNSAEVASDRRLLGVIYTRLEKQKNGKFWVLLRIWSSQELMLLLCRTIDLEGVVELLDSETRGFISMGKA